MAQSRRKRRAKKRALKALARSASTPMATTAACVEALTQTRLTKLEEPEALSASGVAAPFADEDADAAYEVPASPNESFVLGDPCVLMDEWPPPEQEPHLNQEPFCVFAPFDAQCADDEAEPPFDAPSEDDLRELIVSSEGEPAAAQEHAETPALSETAEPQVLAEPPHEPAEPESPREKTPFVATPLPARRISRNASLELADRNTYLAQARVAACEQARRFNRASPLGRRRLPPIAASITAGFAMPLLLAGAWTMTAPGSTIADVNAIARALDLEPTPAAARPALPSSAPTAIPALPATPTLSPPDAGERERDYAEAMSQLAEGRLQPALQLLHRAAENGHVLAQYRLAKLYEHGEGVTRNLGVARQWAERAAQAGNCRAMHDLGVYFAQGDGAPRDEAAAFRWFREAASFGVADSQYNLGVLYQQGRGVTADAGEALFWYLVAALHGDANAVDRAVEVAAGMSAASVTQARDRAHAFQAREPDAAANESPA